LRPPADSFFHSKSNDPANAPFTTARITTTSLQIAAIDSPLLRARTRIVPSHISKQGISMSSSSVSSIPPAAAIQPIEARTPEVKKQDNDDRNPPPPQRPPLPPGQGTRIDQYV
jgi:hypothetical protein